MSVDNVAKFANEKELQPGEFQVIPLPEHNYVRVIYLVVEF